MSLSLRLKESLCALVALAAAGASAQTPFKDSMVQPAQLAPPQRGSLAGQYGRIAFGPADLTRGAFSLPGAFSVPAERGGPGVDLFPVYSPDSGISEWGAGWQATLALTRWRAVGDLDYSTDEMVGPWGRMVQGIDGAWYAQGLQKLVRIDPGLGDTMVATLPDGTRWTFGGTARATTSAGTYAWYLTDLVTITGRQTHLTWTSNGAGRLFLTQVQYGGTGPNYQYQIDFTYETIAQPFVDNRSGASSTLDRRVKTVSSKALQAGVMTERWRQDLGYQSDGEGPAFYLAQVQQTFASGSIPPPIQYGYGLSTSHLASATFQPVPKLDPIVAQFGGDVFQPNRAAIIDVDSDGRTDLEYSANFTLLQQQDAGFTVTPLPPAPPDRIFACRPPNSLSNAPRNLAQLRASDDAYQVVALLASGTGTALTVCNREGQQLYTQQLPPSWAFGPTTHLVDLNRDFQPDLIRISAGSYQIIPNLSTSTGYSFGTVLSGSLSPALPISAAWAHDFNGDGIVDLIGRTDTSLLVWSGLGSFHFLPQAKTFQFFFASGGVVTGLSTSEITFVDANKDGLTDVILSRSGQLTLFLNTGTRLVQTPLPGLSFASAGTTRPVVGDFAGSGDTEVALTKAGHAYSLAVTGPETSLMTSADDGRGNVLSLTYGRSDPVPGSRHRQAVLAGLAIQTTGQDSKAFQYAYQSPVLHSAGRFLVGFGGVVRSDPLMSVTSAFANSDAFAGLPVSSVSHEVNAALADAFEQRGYADAVYQGIPWKRLTSMVSGLRSPDGTQSLSERTDYLDFEAEVCPARTVHTSPWGTLTTTQSRAALSGLGDALHCLPQSIVISGSHPDPSLDFSYTGLVTRNAIGQVTQVQSQGPSGTLTLQTVSYNPDGTVATISTPTAGTSLYGYDPTTLILNQVSSSDGVVTRVTDRDPLTDAIRTFEVNRGAHSYHQFFRYDGLERLAKQWNDLGSASELNPAEIFSYQYATGNNPGTIWNATLVDSTTGAVRTRIDYQTGNDEQVGSASRIPEGWVFGPIVQRKVSTGETLSFLRPGAPVATDPLSLDYSALLAAGTQVGYRLGTASGHDALTVAQLQSNVQKQERTTVGFGSGWLLRTVVQNDTTTFSSALDAKERVVWHEDPSGSRTRFFYDALGRMREVDLADGTPHRVTFDDHGRLSVVARDGLATVRTSYDAAGHVASKTYLTPAGIAVRSVAYAYDGAGRATVETHTDSSSGETQIFQYFYDGATPADPLAVVDRGLLTAVQGSGYAKLFTYRPDGSLASRSVSLDGWRTVDTQLSYFEDGSVRQSVVTVRGPDGAVLSTTDKVDEVDANGRLSQTLLGGAPLASYAYDGNGLLSSISFAAGETVGLRFDAVTRRQVGMDQASGTWTTSTTTHLNNRGFVDEEDIAVGATALSRAHAYTPEGYLASATDAANSYGYGYDANGLISRIDSGGASMPLVRTGSTLQAGPVTYLFDDLGRAIQIGDLSLSYGPDGYLKSATRGTSTWTFLCDEKGVRLAKLSGGAFVAAYLDEGVLDASGLVQPVKAAGTLVGLVSNGAFQLLPADARGTVLADQDGTPHIPSPYGDRAQHPDVASVVDYVQQGYDGDLGVMHMGARDYDPRIHRFLTPDPLYLEEPNRCLQSPVDCNLYGYARNQPSVYRDPDGKNPFLEIGFAVAVETALYMYETPVQRWSAQGFAGAIFGGAVNGAVTALGGGGILAHGIGAVAGGITSRSIGSTVEKALDLDEILSDFGHGLVAGAVTKALNGPKRTSLEIGKQGEKVAADYLESKGYTNLRSIQNKSGHGIDLIGELDGKTRFFEVKTSLRGSVRGLSSAQKDINSFVTSRLRLASGELDDARWRYLWPSQRQDAERLLDLIRSGTPIQGHVISVTNLGTPYQQILMNPW